MCSVDVYEGSIIEYISVKGSKRLAYVTKRQGAHLDVLNELNKSFSIPLHRVATQINGKFEYRDLMKLITSLDSMKQEQVQMVWKSLDDLVSEVSYTNGIEDSYEGLIVPSLK